LPKSAHDTAAKMPTTTIHVSIEYQVIATQ
jgi:hypothetical protein